MSAGILIDNQLNIPPGIDTLADFRRWVHSDDFPEQGRIDWIGGKLEIEMAADNIFWHSTPKSEIAGTLVSIVNGADLGVIVIDKTRVVIPQVDLSCEPDVAFVSHESIEDGTVRFIPTVDQRPDSFLEIEGPPDLIVEIVSAGSVAKDNERLLDAYFTGGVAEYWLVDARGTELSFVILKRGNDGFVPVETDDDGYQRSAVLDNWFRFARRRGRNDLWRYDLDVRA